MWDFVGNIRWWQPSGDRNNKKTQNKNRFTRHSFGRRLFDQSYFGMKIFKPLLSVESFRADWSVRCSRSFFDFLCFGRMAKWFIEKWLEFYPECRHLKMPRDKYMQRMTLQKTRKSWMPKSLSLCWKGNFHQRHPRVRIPVTQTKFLVENKEGLNITK